MAGLGSCAAGRCRISSPAPAARRERSPERGDEPGRSGRSRPPCPPPPPPTSCRVRRARQRRADEHHREQPSWQRPAASRPAAQVERHDLRRRLLTVVVLAVGVGAVVAAVPDLRPVVRDIEQINPALVAAAVALELASCLSFVVIFRLFFAPIPAPAAREMAWSQMGSGALLPGGGVGSLAVGGWLLHLAGMSTRQIVRRSSGLFFLTSAINVIVLARRRARPAAGDRGRPSRPAADGAAGRCRRGRRHRRPRPAENHAPRLRPAPGPGVPRGHRHRDSRRPRRAAATELAPAGSAGLPAV